MPNFWNTSILLAQDGSIKTTKTDQNVQRSTDFKKVVPLDQRPSKHMGRFKPTIYWYTPILMILAFGALITVLTLVILRLGRAAERKNWDQAARDDAYSDTPFRTEPRQSSGSGEVGPRESGS